nr:RHS repeat-associated core domain-containing protein [Pseudoalteromonas sp. NEC-BIFX-2020_015]
MSQIEGQAQKVQVAHTDMLGSTVLITDHQGKGIGQYIYDPWGKQQQVYTSQALTSNAMLLSQMRSFTGHEQMDELEVIHMNGRIYDANIGRFLQADPFVQFPNLTQSHNRYSYVLNNPLTYNDPSGYFLKKLMKITGLTSILKAIASIPILDAAVSIVIGIYAPWALPLYSALKTYAVTGSFGAALKSYVISYATIGVSQYIGGLNLTYAANVAAHAALGGVTSVLQGGKFGHGFVSSLVTASMKGFMNPKTTEFGNEYSRTAIAGVVGGTVSKLTGGKFANGAVTSAMQWWYNAEGAGAVEAKKQQIKEHAQAVREHLAKLNYRDIGDRAKIAGWAIRGGYTKGNGANIVRSSLVARRIRTFMINDLSVDAFNELLPSAMSIASGGMTLIGDPEQTIKQAVGVSLPNIGVMAQADGAMGLWASASAANNYYSRSDSFKMTLNKLDSRSLKYYAENCGSAFRC